LFIDALGLGKLSVGPPYFETVFVPLMAPAFFLMGVGPAARWKQASLPDLGVRLKWAFAVALAGAPDECQRLRQHLSEVKQSGVLFDTARFARNLEQRFQELDAAL
jgi:cytochrome c biogenesis factor